MPDSEQSFSLLKCMQHADSFFPSAAVSFSWGLETMVNRGVVSDSGDVFEFLCSQLTHRWISIDRPLLVAAHKQASNIEALCKLDQYAEAQILAKEQRDGSRRMGMALLTTHCHLETPESDLYKGQILSGEAYGHLSIIQGMVWGKLCLNTQFVQLMSAHGLCTNLLAAAVRLSIVGHIDVQRLITDLRPVIANLVQTEVIGIDDLHSFMPQADIASMKHEVDEVRLFSN